MNVNLNPLQTLANMNTLDKTHLGRVLLHTLCALRDHHWLWHWAGIKRELYHGQA